MVPVSDGSGSVYQFCFPAIRERSIVERAAQESRLFRTSGGVDNAQIYNSS